MLWKVVKYSFEPQEKIKGHKLLRGDVIKIGRVRFKVREIMSPAYAREEAKQKVMKK